LATSVETLCLFAPDALSDGFTAGSIVARRLRV